jgi:hypothetical protein
MMWAVFLRGPSPVIPLDTEATACVHTYSTCRPETRCPGVGTHNTTSPLEGDTSAAHPLAQLRPPLSTLSPPLRHRQTGRGPASATVAVLQGFFLPAAFLCRIDEHPIQTPHSGARDWTMLMQIPKGRCRGLQVDEIWSDDLFLKREPQILGLFSRSFIRLFTAFWATQRWHRSQQYR